MCSLQLKHESSTKQSGKGKQGGGCFPLSHPSTISFTNSDFGVCEGKKIREGGVILFLKS